MVWRFWGVPAHLHIARDVVYAAVLLPLPLFALRPRRSASWFFLSWLRDTSTLTARRSLRIIFLRMSTDPSSERSLLPYTPGLPSTLTTANLNAMSTNDARVSLSFPLSYCECITYLLDRCRGRLFA